MRAIRPSFCTALFLIVAAIFTAPALQAQTFVQVNAAAPASASQVSVAYTQAQVSGDLNVVVIGWRDTAAVVSSVADSSGNLYVAALGPTVVSGQLSQSIYFAKNIKSAPAGTNAVTVTFSAAANAPDVRVLEYSGVDANSPLDGASGASGNSSTTDSGAVTTTYANDLLVGASLVSGGTASAGAGYTSRIITSPNGDLAEDQVVSTLGSYSASSALSSAGAWVMQVVAFRAAGAPPSPSAPTNLTANASTTFQIDLSWTPATGSISTYLIERCQGAGCGNFVQIASTVATTFSDTSLPGGTSFTYRVRAKDTTNNFGPYSNSATAATLGAVTPTAPGNLVAAASTLAPTLVGQQAYINSSLQTVHTMASFDSTGADVLVLFASSHAGVNFTPSDNFGNVWTSAAGPTNTTVGFDLRSQMWYARNPVVGPNHTITMNLSAAQSLVLSVLAVKGSNVSSPMDVVSAIGSDNGTQNVSIASPGITTTAANELLIGFAKVSNSSVFTAGSGFTQQTAASSNYLDAETGLAGTAGTYSATFTVGAPVNWQSAVAAVSPAVASNPNQVNLTWVASTESGGTISLYLVERCQGAGCSSFAQVGTSTTTAYTDSGLTASTTYNYRVRAQDSVGNVGPYSNTATVTTPSGVPLPSITSLTPASGPVGTSVSIVGTNFGATQGTSTVSFNGINGTPTSWGATSIVVPVPAGATTGNVNVTVAGQVSNGKPFTVTIPVPSITSLSPSSGPIGTSVTIFGANFGATQGSSTVSFNGVNGIPTNWSNSSIVVPVPVGTTTGNVTVTVAGQTSNGVLFTIAAAPPPGSITHLQQVSNNDVTGRSYTAFTATFPGGTATGSAIVIGVTYGNANPTITATDSQGNTYTKAISTYDTGHNQGCSILYAMNTRGGAPDTVTVNFSGAVAYLAMGAHEYSGVALTSALDVTAGTKGSGSSISSGTATTTAAGDLIFGCVAEDASGSGDTFTAGSGFTKRVDLGIPAAYADEDGVQGAAGPIATTWTLSPSRPWIAAMAAFKAASAGTGPSITSLSPTSGPVGTSVTVAGVNFGATQGASTVKFNGTTATPTSWSATSITAPVPAGATTGNVVVTVNAVASNGSAFTVTVPPSITSLSPTSGPVSTSVTITGTNFGATQGSSTVKFNGTTATPTSWSATSIVVPVPSGATTGNVVVTVNSLASNGSSFTVTTPPSITNLSPTSGLVGTSVTITGTNFGATQGTSTVTFNGTSATPTSWSATTIAVPVPVGATTGNVVVTVNSLASNGSPFTVTVPPSITNLAPTSGPVGTSVTITGTNFGATQGASSVKFNGTPATPTNWSATSIVVPVPAGAITGNVVVTVNSLASNGSPFTVTTAPGITSLSPTSGPVGTSVTVTGTNFGATQGTSSVTFNGTAATPTSWSNTSIAVPVPAGAITGNVVVTVNSLASNGSPFTVTVPPTITNLSPTSGPVATSVTITGTNFGATQGASTVKFNGTTATPTSWSNTSIAVPVPSGATTGNVVVTVNSLASNGSPFTVTTAPGITSLSPTSGPVGTSVTVTGTNFGATQGASSVTFNGTAATPTSWSNTSIAVPVPAGATTGNVVVTVNSLASNGSPFTVTVPPSITNLSPTSGPVGTSVTITGTNFGATQGASTVKFNGTTATPTSWSNASIAVPVPAGATSGNVVVTVNSLASNGSPFTVTVPPSITNLSPTSGPVGTSVTITGTNFGATQGTSTVKFNGTTATPTSWSNTSIAVPVPAGATSGNVVVTVNSLASNGSPFTVNSGSGTPTAPGSLVAVASTLAPTLVGQQGYINSSLQTTHTMAAFDSTGADVLVLFASSHAGVNFTPSDNFGNVWTSAAGPTNTTVGFDLRSQMWYARNPVVGPNHTITMNLSAAQSLVLSVLAVKGSNVSSPMDVVSAIGSDNGTQTVNIASPGIATTAANELLIGFAKVANSSVFTAGSGFTQQAAASSNYLDAETGLAGTAGTYSATFTVGAPVNWQSAVAAVSPAVASNPNQVNLTWVAATESGGTISLYLVERCQGAGCNSFAQVGTSTTTSYTDSGLTASTTYNYRVRAQDSVGNVGPYSNTATVTTPSGVPLPSITSLTPASGPVGTSVSIVGTNFGATQGTSTVSFNGINGTPTSWGSTSIVVPVPAGATTGNVTVTVAGQVSNAKPFTVTIPVPSITSLSPSSGPVGTSVTVFGTNFGATQGTSTVSFNGVNGIPTNWSNSSIVVPVPVGTTTGNVTVTVAGQTSNGVLFTIAAAPPPGSITHLQQASGSDTTGRSYTAFPVTFPSATTPGSAVIIGVTYGNVNPVISATDSQGNTYALAIASYDSGHSQGCAILYAMNTRGNAADTITVNFSSAVAYLAVSIHEYSGVALTSALNVTAGTKGTGSAPTSGSATTTAAGDLIFGCVAEDATGGGDTFTAGSGFTKRVDLGIAAAFADEDTVQGTAGPIATTWTLSPARDWVTAMAAFKAAP